MKMTSKLQNLLHSIQVTGLITALLTVGIFLIWASINRSYLPIDQLDQLEGVAIYLDEQSTTRGSAFIRFRLDGNPLVFEYWHPAEPNYALLKSVVQRNQVITVWVEPITVPPQERIRIWQIHSEGKVLVGYDETLVSRSWNDRFGVFILGLLLLGLALVAIYIVFVER